MPIQPNASRSSVASKTFKSTRARNGHNMEEAMNKMNKASKLKKRLWWGVAASIAALTVIAATPSKAVEAREELRTQFDKALKGKTVAWAPVWLGVLESEWTRVMKAHFDDYGMKFEVRDANFKSDV